MSPQTNHAVVELSGPFMSPPKPISIIIKNNKNEITPDTRIMATPFKIRNNLSGTFLSKILVMNHSAFVNTS